MDARADSLAMSAAVACAWALSWLRSTTRFEFTELQVWFSNGMPAWPTLTRMPSRWPRKDLSRRASAFQNSELSNMQVYDLRSVPRMTASVPFPAGPSLLRFHPKFSSTILIASSSGSFTLADTSGTAFSPYERVCFPKHTNLADPYVLCPHLCSHPCRRSAPCICSHYWPSVGWSLTLSSALCQ